MQRRARRVTPRSRYAFGALPALRAPATTRRSCERDYVARGAATSTAGSGRDAIVLAGTPGVFKFPAVSPLRSRRSDGSRGADQIATAGRGRTLFTASRRCTARPSLVLCTDPRTGVALGIESPGPQCAFETSMFMCPAVHTTTRILLRPSSTHEPSDPPFRVVFVSLV